MSQSYLETAIQHASDIVYWLDATTGSGNDNSMQRIKKTLRVDLSESPRDLHILHKPGCMVMWRNIDSKEVAGLSSEADRVRPAPNSYTLAGIVSDEEGDFNPRSLDLNPGLGEGHVVTLYPSPKGTRIGMGGGVIGNIRFSQDSKPAAWAVITLTVETSPHTDLNFVAQADINGDFRLSMSRLPPLPENETEYEAKLTIHATSASNGDLPIDPDAQDEVEIGELDEADEFEDELELSVKPGEILNIKSFNREYLAVRPIA